MSDKKRKKSSESAAIKLLKEDVYGVSFITKLILQ